MTPGFQSFLRFLPSRQTNRDGRAPALRQSQRLQRYEYASQHDYCKIHLYAIIKQTRRLIPWSQSFRRRSPRPSLRTVEFRRLFDDKNAARARFELERGQVLKFVVQLECCFDDRWHPILRYDTAHGFAHRDLLRPSGEIEKTEMATQDYNAALTYAIDDLVENWEKYRRRYERWLRHQK